MVAVPARPRPLNRTQWILPVAVIVGSWIVGLWFGRPRWGFCADGIEGVESFCGTGVYNLGAQLGTVGLLVLLVAYVTLALVVKGPRRKVVLTLAVVALGIACLVAAVVLFTVTEPIPVPGLLL